MRALGSRAPNLQEEGTHRRLRAVTVAVGLDDNAFRRRDLRFLSLLVDVDEDSWVVGGSFILSVYRVSVLTVPVNRPAYESS